MPKKPRLFSPIVDDEQLNHPFNTIRFSKGHRPARDSMQEAFELFDDVDGNFILKFQTDAFEAKLFELFLATLFHYEGFIRDPTHIRPDFSLRRGTFELCVEAVTANPTRGAPPALPPLTQGETFLSHWQRRLQRAWTMNEAAEVGEFKSKLIRPLRAKLKKRYWELRHVTGKSLVIAVQDFHAEGSLMLLSDPFARFLYSEFFHLPDVDHVAAIMFVNTGTISKFSRMHYQSFKNNYLEIAGMVKAGLYWPRPQDNAPIGWFCYSVGDPVWRETWSQGISVFHNPMARHPVDRQVFAGTKQLLWYGDNCQIEHPPFHPEASLTSILAAI